MNDLEQRLSEIDSLRVVIHGLQMLSKNKDIFDASGYSYFPHTTAGKSY